MVSQAFTPFSTSQTVLCVAEDQATLGVTVAVLRRLRAGRLINIRWSGDGAEVVRALRPALILLELEAAEGSGRAVYGQLQAVPSIKSIPVVTLGVAATAVLSAGLL